MQRQKRSMFVKMEEVEYCEFLSLHEPRQIRTSLKNAERSYHAKIEALKRYPLIALGSFVGIRTFEGKWIKTNEV